jgi:hypothetical protein
VPQVFVVVGASYWKVNETAVATLGRMCETSVFPSVIESQSELSEAEPLQECVSVAPATMCSLPAVSLIEVSL